MLPPLAVGPDHLVRTGVPRDVLQHDVSATLRDGGTCRGDDAIVVPLAICPAWALHAQLGPALFTAASLVGGLASSPAWLVVARAAQGAGAGFASPSTLSLISVIFREGHARNRALAIFTAVSAVGTSQA